MTRAIVIADAADANDIDRALGYPKLGKDIRGTDVRIASGVTAHHSTCETDSLGRVVYPVDDVEARLSAGLRARVVNVTLQRPAGPTDPTTQGTQTYRDWLAARTLLASQRATNMAPDVAALTR